MRGLAGSGALVAGVAVVLVLGGTEALAVPAIPPTLPDARPAPARSVPAYVGPEGVAARVRPGGGALDTWLAAARGVAGVPVMGDWDGDGAETPGVFRAGRWILWDHAVGTAPRPRPAVRFGRKGDRPVVGDWDGDGRTDLGVVRGNRWLLSRGTRSARGTDRVPRRARFTFGVDRVRPVAGDWDGDGRDGIGYLRGRTVHLRQRPTSGPVQATVHVGRAGRPVAGDWDADGRDEPGAVRGSTWRLAPGIARPRPRLRVLEVPRRAGDVAVPWRTLAGRQGESCPTAARRPGKRGGWVVPSDLLGRRMPLDVVDQDPARGVRSGVRDAERFLLGTHWAEGPSRWAGAPHAPLLRAARKREYAVRLQAMAALTVATAVATGPHRTESVGRTRGEAVRYVDWVVRSLACEHHAWSPGGWGSQWQSDHWATLLGSAAWLVWDRLAPQTQDAVALVVAREANHRARLRPDHWADRNGVVLTPGNTRAEENAWGVALLELAIAMMPGRRAATAWRAASVQLAVAAYATRDDLTRSARINGVALSERLAGFNAYPDHTVENHGRIHPDYATNIQHLWWAADFAGLAGRSVPEAVLHQGFATYRSFSRLEFVAGAPSPSGGTFVEPGGTVYVPGTDTVYYPQHGTWGEVRQAPFVSFDAHAWAWLPESTAGDLWPAPHALGQHIAGQRRLTSENPAGDGRTYHPDPAVALTQDRYPGREEYAASQLAQAWLALYVSRLVDVPLDRSLVRVPTTSKRGPAPLDRRTP